MKDDGDTTRKAALTYDALGQLIEVIKNVTDDTVRYYYDGGNDMVGTDGSDNRSPPDRPSLRGRHGRFNWCARSSPSLTVGVLIGGGADEWA